MAASQVEMRLSELVQEPEDQFSVTVHDTTFPTEAFDADEAEIFQSQFEQLVTGLESSALREILMKRQEIIANAAAFAKQDIDGKVFGGINAGDAELGFSELRPGHIRSDPSDGSSQNDWFHTPSGTGWRDWIGDGSSEKNYDVSENQVSVVLAFVDQSSGESPISGLNTQEWGRNMDMLPHDLSSLRLRDNDSDLQIRELPTMIAREGNTIHTRLRYDRVVQRQPRYFGVTFGTGEFLNAEDY